MFLQDEMERFQLDCVDEPTSVTNNDRLDVYNNIVLFKVREDQRRNSPAEMHIFQCIGRPASLFFQFIIGYFQILNFNCVSDHSKNCVFQAQEVVDEINSARAWKK